jgi:hypothetical protein
VFVLLRRMVDNIANSDEVRALRRYPTLRREIVTAAYRALEKFKEETRKMVNIMVEMERNYITAEYFRTIQVGGRAALWRAVWGCVGTVGADGEEPYSTAEDFHTIQVGWVGGWMGQWAGNRVRCAFLPIADGCCSPRSASHHRLTPPCPLPCLPASPPTPGRWARCLTAR